MPEDWSELSELTALRMSQKVEAKKATTKSAETTAKSALEAVIDGADLINIQSEPSMTKTTPENITAENVPEVPPATAPIANWTGWVQRWGKWYKARILGWCEYGTRYVVEYLDTSGNIGEMFVFPKMFHPEG